MPNLKCYKYSCSHNHCSHCEKDRINVSSEAMCEDYVKEAIEKEGFEIQEIKKDILESISVSKEITYESCIHINKPYRLWQSLLRLYAPLL